MFNFQSKYKLTYLLDRLKPILQGQISKNEPLNFYLLYNGGYRASPFPDNLTLNFEPDLTELMLIYQITLFNEKIKSVYPPGIQFSIVINNGVAKWVNDISIYSTTFYTKQFRALIDFFWY